MINLDGKEEKIKLKGEAKKEFIGWDVPEGAKPIYSTVGDEKIGYATITRYEGAIERYATFADFVDENNKYSLHGIFYQDGHGGLAGTILNNETEYNIILKGSSVGLYESTTPEESTKSSLYITVPYRSQWELCLDEGYSYSEASQACGVAVCAMLEEFYNSNNPELGPIWDDYGSMSATEAEDYLQSQDIDADKRSHTGSLSYVIDCAQYYIDTGRPFYLSEESVWGEAHAVVLRGYNDDSEFFKLNDPNDVSGVSTMYWYPSSNPLFNFEENVYENVGGSDLYSNGMVIVV
ncbi:MAG: C39 family peptidase [Methanosarcina sp.]|uniref:C39 family peptidase n=1 Tax=Methanosarcina sp. TaxID=2213 RepID=UPI00261CC6D8|nr:C39 family peptidase [Methanosarcina sp.]MDD3248030.1 C39 family peptidase [Methanosarcina sp.]